MNKVFFLISVASLLPLTAFSKESKLVFMRKTDSATQIRLTDEDGRNSRDLTSGSDLHLFPDIRWDGKYVVFAEGRTSEAFWIVLQEIASGQKTILSEKNGLHFYPRFSGDGKFVIYSTAVAIGAKSSLIRMNFETRTEVIIPEAESASFPNLSQDGSFAVFQIGDSPDHKRIVRYDFDTQKQEDLTSVGAFSEPAISKDDQWIAYVQKNGRNSNVFIKNLSEGTDINLTQLPYSTSKKTSVLNGAPSFLADGSLIFTSNRTGSFQLYRIARSELHSPHPSDAVIDLGEDDYFNPRSSAFIDLK